MHSLKNLKQKLLNRSRIVERKFYAMKSRP